MKKFLLIKEYCKFILLVYLLQVTFCGVIMAGGSTGPALQDGKISLSFKNESLEYALNKIESQTNITFVYDAAQLQAYKAISIEIQQKTLTEGLTLLLKYTDLKFEQIQKKVVITPKAGHKATLQDSVIEGRVIDEGTGEPIPGVNILIKDTYIGTTTNIEGNYTLDTPGSEAVLIFSFVGYQNKEVIVDRQSIINVELSTDTKSLREVVVTAIGIERETKGLGYSVTKLENKEITSGGNLNLATSLAGKVPGMQLTRSSGPLGSSRIVLRGEASLNLDKNRALIVIDGVPVTNDQNGDSERSYLGAPVDYGDGLSAINPEDIESITVLRGASAAALYGSQAVNGVLMITTKSGKYNQDLNVEVRHSTSLQQVNRWLPRQQLFGSGNRSENDYYAFKDSPDGNQNRNGHSWGPKFMGQNFYQYDSPHSAVYDPERRDEIWEFDAGGQTPWKSYDIEKDFYETGITNTTGISVAAGNNNAYFRGSVDYLTNEYIMPNTGYKRINLGLSSGIRVGKTQFSTKVNYVKQFSDNLPAEGYDRQNAHYQAFWLNANDNLSWYKDKLWLDGQEDIQQNGISSLSSNPYWILYNSINTMDKDRIFGNVELDHNFTNNLKLTARSGIDFYTELRTRERAWSESRNPFGSYRETTLKTMLLNTDIILSQNLSIGDFSFNGSVG
ncbi:MAG: TonB-dependent receptor plug domain-containing protein, partial [Bacteroidota bacterium]|nr:TonB-dependent receptor plug domain-containing protein [Bacteroidota bacterium]